jgi:hypothetical protein
VTTSSLPTAAGVLAAVRRLADGVLFPEAMRVDDLDVLPVAHLDALAAEGLYGAAAPVQAFAREALFLLVFGSRPAIKSALLRRFGAASV